MLLALVMSVSMCVPAFATNIEVSGSGTDVPVELTTEAATFSVTVPTALPINVDAAGVVSVANDAKIINNSYGSVIVSNMTIAGANDWATVDFDTMDVASIKVGTKEVAMTINNDKTTGADTITFTQENFPVIGGATADDTTDELPIVYDAKVPAQSTAISDTTIATVVFTVGWYA